LLYTSITARYISLEFLPIENNFFARQNRRAFLFATKKFWVYTLTTARFISLEFLSIEINFLPVKQAGFCIGNEKIFGVQVDNSAVHQLRISAD